MMIIETQGDNRASVATSSQETVKENSVDTNVDYLTNEEQKEEDMRDTFGQIEDPMDPGVADINVAIPEAQAIAVDEVREAKIMEIYNAPLIEGELLQSPGYAKCLLFLSMTCALSSCLAIAGMTVFVVMVESSRASTPLEMLSFAPTLSPTWSSATGGAPIQPPTPESVVPDEPIVPEVNESDGESPSVSSPSTFSYFAMLVVAITVTAICALAFLVCYCSIRNQKSRDRKDKRLHPVVDHFSLTPFSD